MYVNSTGNVGIGTAAPDYALHVKGWIKEEGSDFYMVDPARGDGGRALVHWGSNNNDERLVLNFDGDFVDGVQVNGPKLIVDSSMGIGTSSPLFPLHVSANETSSKPAIFGEQIGTTKVDAIGVKGQSNSVDGYGYGGYFIGGWKGVYGGVISSNTTSFVSGVYGIATGGTVGTRVGVYGTAAGGTAHYAGYFAGDVFVNGTLTKSAGSFKIDHPLEPANKYLYHSFVESPDMKDIYDGIVVLNNNGEAIVNLPVGLKH